MLSIKSVQLASKILVRNTCNRSFATASAASTKSTPKAPLSKSIPPLPKFPSPSASAAKPKSEPEPFFSDDFVIDPNPVTLPNTPVQPIAKPIQPFKKVPTPPTASKVLSSASSSSPSPSLSTAPPTTPTPAPTTATAPPPPPPAPSTPSTGNKRPNNRPAGSPASPAKGKSPASHAAHAKAPKDELAGRTPAQLLAQISHLQQHNATLQAQLVYHSAVEAIYGESGFNQLRNLISEFTEEETSILKASGFESENVIHLLETRQRELCLQFTQTMGSDLAKHINVYVKKLKDQHRQSASAATATQQTLRNAGVPDAVIASTLVGLQPHLDELQTRIVRWEKLKADVDLLLATHSGNH